jgi:HD superfamily phosphohydrolase YqeK
VFFLLERGKNMDYKELIKKAEEEFIKYVSAYDLNDEKIKLKFEHSFRVKDISHKIVSSLTTNEEDIYLANIIGLLHDIGRFEQVKIYDTFSDLDSFDHADFACKLLFEDNLIGKFNIDKKYYPLIYKAIKNHNKYKIEDNLNKQEMIHAKIIRDADKLDIIYVFYNDVGNYLASDNSTISIEASKQFLKRETIDRHYVKTQNDRFLVMMAFIFDINYYSSYQYLKENNYIEKLYNSVANKTLFEEYFDILKIYLEEKLMDEKNVR